MSVRRGGRGGFAPALCAVGCVALLVACGGSTETEQQASGGALSGGNAGADSAAGGSSTGGATGGGGSVSSVDVPSDCSVGPGHVVLQRLTRSEYDRTVRDLFGVTSAPAQAFPPDSATDGFDNNAQSLTISPQLTELLLDTAEQVANEALVNRHDEIFFCDPAATPGDMTCVRDILSALALRVQRRPATTEEIDGLMAFIDFASTEGDSVENGVGYALQALLMSPQFLYRGIPAAGSVPPAPGTVESLDDHALAARLSYFLWGSTPDDTLLQSAADGELHDTTALRTQFDRMLADAKAGALFDGFVSQWFALGKLQSANPDPTVFPQFNEPLRQAMADEVRLFVEDLRARDASVLELINGTQTFVNADLATLYGIAGVSGTALQSAATDPAQRAGILTMPALLTMTSGPTEPNIVRRGVWLAENILCAKPPPPPEGVPPAPDPIPGETERERLARHRANPTCSSCHNLIDPLGFAFESYDAIGAFRDMAQGVPVDNQGTLPDGRSFAGLVELAQLLAQGSEFPTCATQKLMTYALGRTVESTERCLLSAIGNQTVTANSHLSDWLWAVTTSEAFQMRAAPEVP